ncbi:helix-turn-helix transcriptional regulator [Clostridium oceanicum]|uniref:HTH cro/C1-type domain-containing protein n=1 Tax=Clostridium oceanicum TaxID=1543 RepID=A0ABN1JAG4_9CLOT
MLPKKDLGKLIRKAREYKGKITGERFSQTDLAHEVGKSRGYICDIENGRSFPSFSCLSNIAKVCNVPLDFFQSQNEISNILDKFIKLQLPNLPEEEIESIREALKEDPDLELKYLYEYINNHSLILEKKENAKKQKIEPKPPKDIIKYTLQNKYILDYLGIKKENAEEFSEEVLNQIKLISYKYKK